jgi:acetolactate synthase-1/2/3 large subunit
MSTRTGAQHLVERLRQYDIDTLFALPGYQNDQLFNALHDAQGTPNAIRVLHTRHEQGAAYMAYGYARASGRVGAFAVVPGPGMLNTTAALSTAYAASAPVLAICGQIPTATIGKGYGQLHEIPDSLAVLRSLTKWAARAMSPSEVPALVDEAFHRLRSGRPRPVAIEVPMDVLAGATDAALPTPPTAQTPAQPDPGAIAAAARLLQTAKAPLIMVGGGADDASVELRALAERLNAPVVATTNGRGALSDEHPLALPGPGGHALWPKADVVLAIGTRLQGPVLNWGVDEALTFIRVEVDPEEMTRTITPRVQIQSDAASALRALNVELGTAVAPMRWPELGTVKESLDEAFSRVQPQYDFVRAMRRALPRDGIFVEDLTQVGYASRYMWPSYLPRTHINSNYQGTLGYGFAAALGAKIAHPERAVLCVNGDGGFMYNVQELATAVQHRIGVVVVIFNDGAFGNVRRMQQHDHGGRLIATELRNPDFVKLAEAYGAAGARVSEPAALAAEITAALHRDGPTLIEVPVGEMSTPWRFIMMEQTRGTRRAAT